jgi:hypothetical protein
MPCLCFLSSGEFVDQEYVRTKFDRKTNCLALSHPQFLCEARVKLRHRDPFKPERRCRSPILHFWRGVRVPHLDRNGRGNENPSVDLTENVRMAEPD